MKNVNEFSNEDLLCKFALYKDIKIDCSDFIHKNHIEYEHDCGYERSLSIFKIEYSNDFKRLIDFMLDSRNIYIFCPLCNKQMSFQMFPVKISDELKNNVIESYAEEFIDEDFCASETYKMSQRMNMISTENRLFDKVIRCTHDNSHIFKFSFLLKIHGQYPNEYLTLMKIGQYPSINDFSGENIKAYQKLLKEYSKEYSKALGLYSAGIGIGSFVYLRRIIEFLLENAFQKAESAGAITRENYMKDKQRNRRVDEKIKLLKGYLPEFMVSHADIYGIVSKGIHELSEDECKEIFPALQKSIELILDEEISLQKKQEDIVYAENELKKIKQTI